MNENQNACNAESPKVERKMMVDLTQHKVVTESTKRVPQKFYTRPTTPKQNTDSSSGNN